MKGIWLVMLCVPLLLSACDECAGTPSCHGQPEVSATGQFIDRTTGQPVPRVQVAFVRRSGIELIDDTITTVADDDGHFTLRAGSIYTGTVSGDLIVTPPEPFEQYTMAGVSMETSTIRGEGVILGRIVVNPYLLLIGHVRDRKTLQPLANASVLVRRVGGGTIEPAEGTFTTDAGGQFKWEPSVTIPDTILAEFQITVPRYPRTYIIRRKLQLLFRDNDLVFQILPVGYGLAYVGATGRRGGGAPVSVRIEWERVSGIRTDPADFTLTPDANGLFGLPLQPLDDGSLVGELRVVPSPPIPPETTLVQLRTQDDDQAEFLGFFRYGSQVLMHAQLRDAETNEALPSTTGVTMKHVSGVSLAWTNPLPGGDLVAVSDSGTITYGAPTSDSGSATFDVIVRHPAPYIPDTIRTTFPSRYSDSLFQAGIIHARRRTAP